MRAARVLLATLVLAAGLLLPSWSRPAPALAVEPQALVSITVDSFTPALPRRDSTITVTGTVTNTSKKRLYRLQAYFWRNQAPITDSEGFDSALASAANEPLGARYVDTYANLYEPGQPYLERGATARFTLHVKVAALDLPSTSGVYLMGVHVLQNSNRTAVGRARLFVPVVTGPQRNVLQMTTVVALNSRPALVRSGSGSPAVFSDDHLATELAPGGRLDALLRAADAPDVSYAVDPELIEEVEAMKAGYQVLSGDATTTSTGWGQATAARWLDAFTQLARNRRDGFRLPYGSLDLAAVTHAGQHAVLQQSVAAARTVAASASLPLLVWPAGGLADAATVQAAESLKPAAVLLSESSTRASRPLLQGLGSAPIVSYSPTATSGGPGPAPDTTPAHLQQRLLAETWIEATTQPAGTTLGRVRLISTRTEATATDQDVTAPWVRRTTLAQLLHSTPVAWSQKLRYTETAQSRELSAAHLADLHRFSRSNATWVDLLADPTTARATAGADVARAASSRWRGEDDAFATFLRPQQSRLDDLFDQVSISVTGRVITPKSQVKFPVTIRNELPVSSTDDAANAIRVRLRFRSANSQRLTVEPADDLAHTVDARSSYTSEAVVNARTNGTVRVTAQVYTASGLPVGKPAPIDVRATQAGTVGWFIAIGAGIVLVGGSALRIRQVTRERARTADATGSAGGTDGDPDGAPLAATRSAPAEDTSESIDV